MPNNEVGPKTLERVKAIKEEFEGKVEDLGRQLGIPEAEKEKIYALIQIDEIRQFRAQNDRLHAEAVHRDKDGRRFDPLKFAIGAFNQIAGVCKQLADELGKFSKK